MCNYRTCESGKWTTSQLTTSHLTPHNQKYVLLIYYKENNEETLNVGIRAGNKTEISGLGKVSGEDFTLDDFLEQLEAMSKMGSMGKLLGMLPGAGAMKKQIENFDESEITRTKSIVQSMTPGERRDVKVLNGSRRARIALGAGRKVSDVNSLVDKFTAAQKMMKQMRNGGSIPGMPGMPPGMPGLPPAPRKAAPPAKKKSKSGNPAKRALENGTIS